MADQREDALEFAAHRLGKLSRMVESTSWLKRWAGSIGLSAGNMGLAG